MAVVPQLASRSWETVNSVALTFVWLSLDRPVLPPVPKVLQVQPFVLPQALRAKGCLSRTNGHRRQQMMVVAILLNGTLNKVSNKKIKGKIFGKSIYLLYLCTIKTRKTIWYIRNRR